MCQEGGVDLATEHTEHTEKEKNQRDARDGNGALKAAFLVFKVIPLAFLNRLSSTLRHILSPLPSLAFPSVASVCSVANLSLCR